jgi:hypothetical protein
VCLSMTVNFGKEETQILEKAIAWLRDRLPGGWEIEAPARETLDLTVSPDDAKITLKGPGGTFTAIAIEVRRKLEPRTVVRLLAREIKMAKRMGAYTPLLVVAPWLSRRTQELLTEEGLSYIDLTGNALVRIDNPAFYLQTSGADRDPAPKDQQRAQLRGPKAGRLIRFLIDVRGPYGLSELAGATRLTPGYVSRLLDTLDREALIERVPRGPVESVDIAGLLRRWASSYDVFRSNQALSLIAPSGIEALLEGILSADPNDPEMVITGSFAAAAMTAPIAAPALLVAYCKRPRELASEHGLLPSEEGANVVLLSPFDPVAEERASFHNHLAYAAPSQVVVDCLTGNGRMPAEGEALLEWMVEHEPAWRIGGIDQMPSSERHA